MILNQQVFLIAKSAIIVIKLIILMNKFQIPTINSQSTVLYQKQRASTKWSALMFNLLKRIILNSKPYFLKFLRKIKKLANKTKKWWVYWIWS